MRISDWSSDVCSSDLDALAAQAEHLAGLGFLRNPDLGRAIEGWHIDGGAECCLREADRHLAIQVVALALKDRVWANLHIDVQIAVRRTTRPRSEEHTSELQSIMRISYAVFCLKKKQTHIKMK